eukprot:jgi/Botrbrau1/4382/Bobra.105_2s0028.1
MWGLGAPRLPLGLWALLLFPSFAMLAYTQAETWPRNMDSSDNSELHLPSQNDSLSTSDTRAGIQGSAATTDSAVLAMSDAQQPRKLEGAEDDSQATFPQLPVPQTYSVETTPAHAVAAAEAPSGLAGVEDEDPSLEGAQDPVSGPAKVSKESQDTGAGVPGKLLRFGAHRIRGPAHAAPPRAMPPTREPVIVHPRFARPVAVSYAAQHPLLVDRSTLASSIVSRRLSVASREGLGRFGLPLPADSKDTNQAGQASIATAPRRTSRIEDEQKDPEQLLQEVALHYDLNPIKDFVYASGREFFVNGRRHFFAGTNAYYLAMRDYLNDPEVVEFFRVTSQNGLRVVRIFGFVNGYGEGRASKTQYPIQILPGQYDEASWRRLDFILAAAHQFGVHLIIPLVNSLDELGGMQWYVDHVLGVGHEKELFYTDAAVKQAFKNYVTTFLFRKNTITGRLYKDDPTIFSVELANEPHTTYKYEMDRGMIPGRLIRDWVWEMAAFIRGIDPNHMISSGEEGYRADGPVNEPYNSWMNSGAKGVDFAGNIWSPNISFATIHVYPETWGIPATNYAWVLDNFIRDRARIVAAANKPFVLEEYGMPTKYAGNRRQVMRDIQDAALSEGAGAVLVWQIWAWPIKNMPDSFNFAWDDEESAQAIRDLVRALAAKTDAPMSGCGCTDAAPDSAYTCAEQKAFGKCDESWMEAFAYCQSTCGRCGKCLYFAADCTDDPPSNEYSCEQQVKWGKCSESFMLGHCERSCGRC